MKLIPGWRRSWRLWSVRASAIGALVAAAAIGAPDMLLTAWNALPDDVRLMVPSDVGRWLEVALFGATIAARVIKQKDTTDDE